MRKISVCHASDWHGRMLASSLPESDLYVFTGDMFPDFVLLRMRWDDGGTFIWDPLTQPWPRHARLMERIVDRERSSTMQAEWASRVDTRALLSIPRDAQVLCVRGNHDFADASLMFGGGPVWEPQSTLDVWEGMGIRVAGVRGINSLVGEWSDELTDEEWDSAVAAVPGDIDVLISHSPPLGTLDEYDCGNLGSQALVRLIDRCTFGAPLGLGRLKLHCFGHVHERACSEKLDWSGKITFSNAALGYNVLTIEV